MEIGVIYPQTEIEPDAAAVRHYTQAVVEMGFAHVVAYDHVLGANRASRPGKSMPYDLDSPFQEPFVLFGYMAGIAPTLGFITSILILPQRQTVLVAKQAACVDLMCGGRLRVAVGTGWNEVEYEALGADFPSRGARIEEQIAVLRALWSEPAVTFKGEQHTITDAGLTPMPVQRPIPVWFGGGIDRALTGKTANLKVLRRIGRLGDGWNPAGMSPARTAELLGVLHGFCREYGRDPAKMGLQVSLEAGATAGDGWADEVKGWQAIGATHLAVNTMNGGLRGVDAHLERLAQFHKAVPAAAWAQTAMSICLLDKRPDGIGLITLNAPERMNAMGEAMGQLVEAYIEDCEADPAVRCLAITGTGKAFCAGGDIGEMKGRTDTGGGVTDDRGQLAALDRRVRRLRRQQDRAVLRLHTMPKPTVAIVGGHAIGAGLSYALACDIRLMGDGANLSAGFARMALSGDMGGTYFLSKLVNTAIARELCFTAENIDAARALSLGLVNKVYPQASLLEEALAYCAKLAAGPTAAFGRMKENLNFAWTHDVNESLDFESRNMVFGSLSRDHQEAVNAFMEKRPPRFTGD